MSGTISVQSRLSILNSRWHRPALAVFMVVVLAHWAEHLAQAFQIYVLGMSVPDSRGVLGMPLPWLVHSEWMHYAYALLMLIGLIMLRRGFRGRARTWWAVSLGIQAWHHFEHLLLLIQAQTGANIAGSAVPVSIVQLVFPRVELHLFYNTIVFVPMLIAMVLHTRPNPAERARMICTCARPNG